MYTGRLLQTRLTKLREYSSPKLTNTPAIRNVEYNGIKKESSTKKRQDH
jgi:hypothetical protein